MSVGATEGVSETSATLSGGGFSNIFAQQTFQAAAVTSYLAQLGATYQGLFNPAGRAYPDVSAQGERILIVYRGYSGLVAGTSASSPIFGSVIALINDRLAAVG